MTGQGGGGPVELTDEQRAAVLTQVAGRRAVAAELTKDLPQESATDLMRRRNEEWRAKRAEAAGQLDLGGV